MASSAHARTLSPVAALVDGMLDLVPLPQAYVRIREIVEDPAASLRAISEVVTSDPALTGRVLRLANSAFYASVSRVDTVDHAVRILGLSQIHDIALATSAVGSLSRLKGDLVNVFEFWRVSVYCAVCARQLAHGAGLPLPQRLFIAGLMHNIGNLVIAHELPDTYRDILALARTQELPLADIERRVLGFDYADVGAELMRQWNLPSGLIYPVALHTRPLSEVSAAEQPWVAVVQVAAATARAATWVDAGSEPIPDYDPIAIALLGVDAERIEALMQETDEQVSEFVAILLPNA